MNIGCLHEKEWSQRRRQKDGTAFIPNFTLMEHYGSLGSPNGSTCYEVTKTTTYEGNKYEAYTWPKAEIQGSEDRSCHKVIPPNDWWPSSHSLSFLSDPLKSQDDLTDIL